MATLTETAYYTRRIILFLAASFIGFFVVRGSLATAKEIWLHFHPPGPPPPTMEFGKLPPLEFPETETTKTELSYQLETIGGGLPTLAQTGKVYFMPDRRAGLLALDRAKEKAANLGFSREPSQISELTFLWQKGSQPETTLRMNIATLNFDYRWNYEEVPSQLTTKNLPTNVQAQNEALNFFSQVTEIPEDLQEGEPKFSYFRFVAPRLLPAPSLSEADFVRVDFFRNKLDKLDIFPASPLQSEAYALFSGARERGQRIVDARYNYFPIEAETFATYPLKPVQAAWQELQTGEAYLANLGQNTDGRVTIRQAYLAYYDSPTKQAFLQPIFVFTGDREFFAYVPAIDPEWVSASQ